MKIVTYNLRCIYDKWDGVNSFIHRAGFIYEKITAENPEIIAFQEVVEKSRDFLVKLFPEYIFLGHFRNADYTGEGVFTAVRKDAIEVLGFEDFWLSPTPAIAGSRYENQSQCPRTCLMTQLRHKESGKLLRIYNLHLDHVSDEARQKGMECVFEAIKGYNERLELPSVILGDFNALPEDGVMRMCDNNTSPQITDVTKDIPFTFHGYGKCEQKIDYIYMTKDLADNLKRVYTWDDKCVWHEDVYHGADVPSIYLSDHYPVCAEIEI